jgi:ABC-2 type transport system ATP-binding protein
MNGRPELVIETEGLTRFFGNRKVVDAVSLRVPRGSVFAFLGSNATGKSTTIRMLLGLLRPTRGTSRILGEDSLRLRDETRARIGYTTESHAVHDWMTVAEAGAYQSRFLPGWDDRIFTRLVAHFGLAPNAKARSLSRGQRAVLSLALALAPQPELLVLDDPTLGLDPVTRRSILEFLVTATRETDRTIFLSSHQLDDVERYASHVAVLDRGALRVQCPIEEVRRQARGFALTFAGAVPAVPRFRGLLASRTYDEHWLGLTVVRPDDDARRIIHSLGAISVEEKQVGFDEVIGGYLADGRPQGSALELTEVA